MKIPDFKSEIKKNFSSSEKILEKFKKISEYKRNKVKISEILQSQEKYSGKIMDTF